MKKKEKIELLKKIDRYIRGDLSQPEIDELWMEFLRHPESYEWFETELHLRSLIKKGKKPAFLKENEKPSGLDEKGKSTDGYNPWLFAAAAAVLIVVGIQFFSLDRQSSLQNMAVATIEQNEMMGADIQRSEGESDESEQTDVAINEALAYAYEGETEAAIDRFLKILEERPDDRQTVRVQLNLAILFYNEKRYERAADFFAAVLENGTAEAHTREKALWFLGNTHIRKAEFEKAGEILHEVYRLDGRFREQAATLLTVLNRHPESVQSPQQPAPAY